MFHLLSKKSPLIPYLLLILQIACWTEMDLFAPSLPDIMRGLNTNEAVIQWAFSLNFLGFFLSSLFVGPLADAFGRRPILLIGSLVFVFGGIISFLASNIEFFLLGRLIQGVGVGAPAVLGIAILGDIYQGEKQVKMLSLINSIITITMAVAPIVGAAIASYLGWRANFGVICALAFIGLSIVWFFIPETLVDENRRPFYLKDLISNYKRLLLHRQFIQPCLGLGAMVTPYFIFVGSISLIFIDELGMPMSEYVLYQGVVVGCFAVFSLWMPRLTNQFDIQILTRLSILLSSCGGVLLAFQGLFLADSPLPITILMCFYAIGLVLPCTAIFIQATEAFPELRASASALSQALRMLMLSFGTSLMGVLYNDSYAPIGALTGVLVVLGCIGMWPFIQKIPRRSSASVIMSH